MHLGNDYPIEGKEEFCSVGADPCVRPRVSFLSIMPGQGQAPVPVLKRGMVLFVIPAFAGMTAVANFE